MKTRYGRELCLDNVDENKTKIKLEKKHFHESIHDSDPLNVIKQIEQERKNYQKCFHLCS